MSKSAADDLIEILSLAWGLAEGVIYGFRDVYTRISAHLFPEEYN